MIVQVGRDPGMSRMVMIVNGQPVWYGQKTDVPESVSSCHCTLDDEGGMIRLRNTNFNHETFVNGQPILTKVINHGDRIELGDDHYPLDWSAIDKVLPPKILIGHLEKIWNDYEKQRMELQIAERKFNSIRSATGIITMLAIALSMMLGRQSFWYVVLYAFAIIASALLTYKAYRNAASVPQKQQALSKQFQKDYVCPHCRRFLGNQSYDLLRQNTCCPYCKTQFVH